MLKKLIRKNRHRAYVRRFVIELQWESLNTILIASKTEWNDSIVGALDNNAKLIRKYERRQRWLRF